MENITKINVAQIVSVKVNLKAINKNYEFRETCVSSFLWIKKTYYEGFYQKSYGLGGDINVSKEFILENNNNLYIENNIIYFKPYITVRMSNNTIYQLYFESVEALEGYINKNLYGAKFIDLL